MFSTRGEIITALLLYCITESYVLRRVLFDNEPILNLTRKGVFSAFALYIYIYIYIGIY
jgi:hypothetical protein